MKTTYVANMSDHGDGSSLAGSLRDIPEEGGLQLQVKNLVKRIEALASENEVLKHEIVRLGEAEKNHQREIRELQLEIETSQMGQKSLEAKLVQLGDSLGDRFEDTVSKLEARLSTTAGLPFYFTLQNFAHYKKHSLKWQSPPFYSHPYGYKLCIGVSANGDSVGTGTHVSLSVYLLKGEYDEQLMWPFRGSITINLLNERRDGGHFEVTIEFTDDTPLVNSSRVLREERSAGWGNPLFISHARLGYDHAANTQFLKYDRLRFVVSQVKLQ